MALGAHGTAPASAAMLTSTAYASSRLSAFICLFTCLIFQLAFLKQQYPLLLLPYFFQLTGCGALSQLQSPLVPPHSLLLQSAPLRPHLRASILMQTSLCWLCVPGVCRDRPEVSMVQMTGNLLDHGENQLDMQVSEITLKSMSTLPLYRDNVFCQVEVNQDVGNPQFGTAAKLCQRTDSVSAIHRCCVTRSLPPLRAWHRAENWCFTVFESTISASWVKRTTLSNYRLRHWAFHSRMFDLSLSDLWFIMRFPGSEPLNYAQDKRNLIRKMFNAYQRLSSCTDMAWIMNLVLKLGLWHLRQVGSPPIKNYPLIHSIAR